MTEKEWLSATDPNPMLLFLSDKTSERKCRLLACAFCRDEGKGIRDSRFWNAVEFGERWADGEGDEGDEDDPATLDNVQDDLYQAINENIGLGDSTFGAFVTVLGSLVFPDPLALFVQPVPTVWGRVKEIGRNVMDRLLVGQSYRKRRPYPESFCFITRDIIGNPFRPVVVDPSWLTSDVLALAKGIYEEKAFDRMPILADALQDAGCDNEHVLNHLREPGLHVKGCWALDLVLGKG